MTIYNYHQLSQYLSQKAWKDADIETRKLMLQIAEVQGRRDLLLTKSDIQNFPCTELQKINALWVKKSQGRFGFSVIHRVYQSVNYDYGNLATRVGWRNGDQWLNYNQINFTNNAPIGHLPLTWLVPTTFWMYWSSRVASAGWKLLLKRIEECDL